MSRDEARKRLQGTFSFKLSAGNVIVHDEALISEIHDLMAASSENQHAPDWAASENLGRPVSYGAVA